METTKPILVAKSGSLVIRKLSRWSIPGLRFFFSLPLPFECTLGTLFCPGERGDDGPRGEVLRGF